MRGHLRLLRETGIVTKRRQNDFPGNLDYELGRPGHELLTVAEILEAWLAVSPEGPLPLGSAAAKSCIKALAEGWSSTLLRALAAKPLSLTELDRLIVGISYPSLERRLAAMRHAGQIQVCSGQGLARRPYEVTEWLRHAVAPLVAASRWERVNAPSETVPMKRLDAEAAFLLAIPLLDLPAELSGTCRLVAEVEIANGHRLAGVLVGVRGGQVTSCVARVQGPADAWASGSAPAWLRAIIEQDMERIEMGGDWQLVRALLDGLHSVLFEGLQRAPRV